MVERFCQDAYRKVIVSFSLSIVTVVTTSLLPGRLDEKRGTDKRKRPVSDKVIHLIQVFIYLCLLLVSNTRVFLPLTPTV